MRLLHFATLCGLLLASTPACRRAQTAPAAEEPDLDERRDFACTPCGCWRWAPKTAADSTVNTVSTAVQDTTIGALGAFTAPSNVNTGISTRYQPPTTTAEVTTWRLTNVKLLQFKAEPDSDIHLAIQDPNDASKTMIAEVPDGQNCVSGSSPYLAQIKAARATFAARCSATGSYQTPAAACSAGSDVVTLVGIGLFDELHGATDAAPNGLELHPVISLCFGQGCGGGTTGGSYLVGGTISGLTGGGLSLKNGADTLSPAPGQASFTFPTKVQSGGSYSVSIAAQPTSPWQTCGLSNGAGTVGNADVSSVAVACTTNRYSISATVSGLAGAGLVLHSGADAVSVTSNGTVTFPTQVASGQPWSVTASPQPSGPAQTCTVTSGSGTVQGGAVSVAVACTTSSFSVGGRVFALTGAGLRLSNGADLLDVAPGASSFTMPGKVQSGQAYAVAIARQPAGQTCSIAGESGTVGSSDVSSVSVNCSSSSFTVGGSVQGLSGALKLTDNGGDELVVTGNGSFAFATPLATGAAYAVAVSQQPQSPAQVCSVSGGAGQVGSQNVTSVRVTCATSSFAISGSLAGLQGAGLVLRNGAEQLTPGAGASSFAFLTKVASGASYDVLVAAQPGSPSQTCTVAGGAGVVAAADVTSVAVSCTTNRYRIGGAVTGLQGDGLVLRNGAEQLEVSGGSQAFQFAGLVQSGVGYSVAVVHQPLAPAQTCTIAGAAGTVGAADVSLSVACTTDAVDGGAGQPDAGQADAGQPDAGQPDAGSCPRGEHLENGKCVVDWIGQTQGGGCSAVGPGSWACVLVAAAWLRRRNRSRWPA